jgi:hypothetical protein
MFEYVLGIRSPSGLKAAKGTVLHKVMEILAIIKKGIQDGLPTIEDDIIGKINTKDYNLNTIIEKVYNHYSSAEKHHSWTPKDYKDCHNWVYKALEYNNGMFDPRNQDIVQPEQRFDIEIDKPWAKYKYETKDGTLEGNLAIKGTIDLITRVNDKTLEIVDYKTGRRLDWATGEEKTQAKLQNDAQLRIYHYAIQHLYPEIEHVMVSIYFINDGGAFSICFDKKDIFQTEMMLKAKFETIKNTYKPQLNKSWKCTKFCHFGKSTFANTHVLPIIEYRDNQVTPKDQCMTKCEQVKHDMDIKGVDEVVDQYQVPGYSIGHYKAPGSV